MLVILPPSETKADGGRGLPLDLSALSYPVLTSGRTALIAAVQTLALDLDASLAALKLSPKQRFEVERNRALMHAPTMPALERYTGVLYDPINAASLSLREREFAGRHIVVHSALFGFIGAADPVPAYRLSHDSRVPGFALKKHWKDSIQSVFAEHDGLILDLRSQSYVALGPAPAREGSYYLRAVTEGPDGRTRALNHFNKKAKGDLVRALISSGARHTTAAGLIDWAARTGIRLTFGAPGELELVV